MLKLTCLHKLKDRKKGTAMSLKHLHSAEDCDLIVCWSHNWPECPFEVLELRRAVPGGLLCS